jgi:tRNA pseudouridine-54 N-methylase
MKKWIMGLVAGLAALVFMLLGRRSSPAKVIAKATERDTAKVRESEEMRAEMKKAVDAAEELRHEPTPGAMTEDEAIAKGKAEGWLK